MRSSQCAYDCSFLPLLSKLFRISSYQQSSISISFLIVLCDCQILPFVQVIHLLLLNCRLGHIEDAQRHLSLATPQPDLLELHKLQTVEKHLGRCMDARKVGDWKSVLRESDASIAAGADCSAMVGSHLSCTMVLSSPFLIKGHTLM